MRILALISIITFCACFEPDLNIQPIEEEPDFPIFTMEVNGNLWEPSGANFGGGWPVILFYKEDSGFISIGASSIYDQIEGINISSDSIYLYQDGQITRQVILRNSNDIEGCQHYEEQTEDSPDLIRIIELDTEKRIIKIEFQFDCINACEKVMKVRNGLIHATYT